VKPALAIAACILLVSTLSTPAAPYLPAKVKLAGDVRSLAGLTAVRLEASQRAKELIDAGLTGIAIEQQARQQLSQGMAEMTVVEDADAPLLKIEVYGGIESNVPDALAFLISVKLIQTVHVARTDETLEVPTYTMVRGGVDKLAWARRATEREIRSVLDTFMMDRMMATQGDGHHSEAGGSEKNHGK